MTKEQLMACARHGARAEVRRLVAEFGPSVLEGAEMPGEMPGEAAPAPRRKRHWTQIPGNAAKLSAARRKAARTRARG